MAETYTREDMVAELTAPEPVETKAEPVAEVKPEEDSSAPTDGDTSEALEPGDGVEGKGPTEETTEEVEAEAVDPPQWWDAEDKEVFASLTPEQQAVIAKNEAKRETVTAKSKQEAAEIRKAAETKVSELTALSEKISQALPKAEQAFQSRWEGMTAEMWVELSNTDPQAAFQLKVQYDQEMADLQSVRATEAEAAKVAQEAHYTAQAAKLKEIAPDLASKPEALKATGEYIIKSGIAPEAIAHATAEELTMAYKAMLWDQAQAKAKAKVDAPAPIVKPGAKVVAPTARVAVLPPQQKEIQQLRNRFNQTKSREDLVNLLALEG